MASFGFRVTMRPDTAYQLFSDKLMSHETLTIKSGKGGLSYYKNGVFVCHFNARPQKNRPDLGYIDFRFVSLRSFLDVEAAISAMRKEALPELEIKKYRLWCSLHFPLSRIEHVANLFLKHIISKVNTSSE